jgi:DnaJ like chaperone protein
MLRANITAMAQWTGKVVGGLIGMLALGPFGAAVGVLLGHQFDASAQDGAPQGPMLDAAALGERFFRTTFQVMGHIAKADGRVSEQEIDAARSVMADLRLDPLQVRTAISHFTSGKQPAFNLQVALAGLRAACAGRPDLLRVFMEIQMRAALAGSNLDAPVRGVIQRVAAQLGVSLLELAQMETVLRIRSGSFAREPARAANALQLEQAYRVLECAADASNDDVVRAYRRQLSRHHPDKLKANGLPESMIEHAKQRTQQIIEAYELIRERRAM